MTLYRFCLHRLYGILLSVWGATLLAFALVSLAPGDPAEIMLDTSGMYTPSVEEIQEARERLGLTQPLWRQYVHWLQGILTGDWGTSFHTGRPVLEEILRHALPTGLLALLALFWTILGSLLLACFLCLSECRMLQHGLHGFLVVLLALPNFLGCLLLIYIWGEVLGLLPTGGNEGFSSYLLPSLALSSVTMATNAEFLYMRLQEERHQPYALVAHARGISKWRWFFRYPLPNAALSSLAIWGNFFGATLGGSIVVETLFGIPGLGSLAFEAASFRDRPLLEGYVVFVGISYAIATTLADMLAYIIDPRALLGGEKT